MAENQHSVILRDLRPTYYDQFHCLAQDCKLNCCQDWNICFSRSDYVKLKNIKASAELQNRLALGLQRIRRGPLKQHAFGEFKMRGGLCPLLQEDGLCMLQVEKGLSTLPEVCRLFPRIKKYTTFGYLERSLTLACEGVLALLWELPDGVVFASDSLPKTEQENVEFVGKRTAAERHQIRSQCIDILQERKFTLPQRILLMGLLLKELDETDTARWLAKAQAFLLSEETPKLLADFQQKSRNPESLIQVISNNIHVLLSIQEPQLDFLMLQQKILNGIGVPNISGSKISFTGCSEASLLAWARAKNRFMERYADKDFFMENLMTALFFQLSFPDLESSEKLWKSYVNFCNLYSFLYFMMIMGCRDGAAGDRQELFYILTHACRMTLHNRERQNELTEELFRNESADIAHMAILLSL